MAKKSGGHFTRREREIMDIIYQRGQATAAEVMENLQDPPSYSAVRALLRVLEEKGNLKHEINGQKYVFRPIVPRARAKRSALKRMVDVFFDGSTEAAVTALLETSQSKLTNDEWERLAALIERARKEGS